MINNPIFLVIDSVLVLDRCSTTVETFPSAPSYNGEQLELQNMRVSVGPPLKQPPHHQIVADPLMPAFSSINSESAKQKSGADEVKFMRADDPVELSVFCTSDFTTVSKEVYLRTRRVRLVGLEVFIPLFHSMSSTKRGFFFSC